MPIINESQVANSTTHRLHIIGPIMRVQVQRSSLKVGSPQEYYDPSPLLEVAHLQLETAGVVGVTAEGRQYIDIHNERHPESRYIGKNGISLNFTSHYASMRTRFGTHLVDGIAGENILVETTAMYTREDLAKGLAIQNQETGAFVYLTHIGIASPCLPFSSYASGVPQSNVQIKEALQFLHHGRRGFYMELAETSDTQFSITFSITKGDILFRVVHD